MKKLADGGPPQPGLAKPAHTDCCGLFISLQLRAGAGPLEVARWARHSPQVMFNHYANVIDDLVGDPVLSAVEQITRARDAVWERERQEPDKLMAELFESPTVAAGPAAAAELFFKPEG